MVVFFTRTEKRIDSKKRIQRADLVAFPNWYSLLEKSFMQQIQQMTRILNIFLLSEEKRRNVEILFKKKNQRCYYF